MELSRSNLPEAFPAGLFDTHTHYDDEKFDGVREELLCSLFERGLSGLIHASVDFASCRFGLELSGSCQRAYAAIGLHPENLYDAVPGWIERLRELYISAGDKKPVAIGEIGLDYHYPGYDRTAQLDAFCSQLELAGELGLPVIIHCRDAIGDCVDVLRGHLSPSGGVMHCYSGSKETARELIDMGLYISFTGTLTFKNSKKQQEVVKYLPPDRLLLETDCPYMAPEPLRGRICDSSMLIHTASAAAVIKELDPLELVLTARENTRRLFGV